MGDLSNEPSMEDILSSIKRIIAEEGDGSAGPRVARRPAAGRGTARAYDPVPVDRSPPRTDGDDGDDAVLELRESIEAVQRSVSPPPAEPERDPVESKPEADAILSTQTAEATRGQLEALSRLIVRPETPGSDTLEGMVREMLRPMLSDWLDANLPRVVETMVAREIARITNRQG